MHSRKRTIGSSPVSSTVGKDGQPGTGKTSSTPFLRQIKPHIRHPLFILVVSCTLISSNLWPTRNLRATPNHQPPVAVDEVSIFSPPPLTCDQDEMNLARKRFSRKRLRTMTTCPEPSTWWDKYLAQTFFALEYRPELQKQHEEQPRTLLGISLGCNKGDDAVDMLRKLSLNDTFSSEKFRAAFAPIAKRQDSEAGTKRGTNKRACPEVPPSPLDDYITFLQNKHLKPNDAIVHCVEAMPNTAATLQATVTSLSPIFDSRFFVTHAAVGPTTGFLYFPSKGAGIEDAGLGNCEKDPEKKPNCAKVPSLKIDDFVRQKVLASNRPLEEAVKADLKAYEHLEQVERNQQEQTKQDGDSKQGHSRSIWASYQPNFVIDWLNVDLEGYDWQGLGQGGADWTLHHTGYLEFEYHGVGAWKKDKLREAVEYLNKFGFTCYWAGNHGWLARMTNCFQSYMEMHQWSNVACANRYLRPHLAAQMENIYHESLLYKFPKGVKGTEPPMFIDATSR